MAHYYILLQVDLILYFLHAYVQDSKWILKIYISLTVKRILRYLKGTPNLGIWYPKESGFNLIVYTDSDYAGSVVDRKSTSWSCQFQGNIVDFLVYKETTNNFQFNSRS